MKLTDQKVEKLIMHLNAIVPQGVVCPVCGNKQWAINDIVVESQEFQNGNIIIGANSAIVPYVTLTCRKCAHTLFFNAIQLGVVDPKEQGIKNEDNNGK